MDKSINSENYRLLLRELQQARRKTGLSQQQLAKRLGETQSFVSKCERGERRIDVIELMAFCKALNIDFVDFVTRLQDKLDVKG